jgi:hypothetical protein
MTIPLSPRDGRKARKGQDLIRKVGTLFRLVDLSVESSLSQRKANRIPRTTTRRPFPARNDTDLRTRVRHDAGGNEGSKGQNVDSRRSTGTGKEPRDTGDYRGRSRTRE